MQPSWAVRLLILAGMAVAALAQPAGQQQPGERDLRIEEDIPEQPAAAPQKVHKTLAVC